MLTSIAHGAALCGWGLAYAVRGIRYTTFVQKVCHHFARINIFYVKFFQWFTATCSDGDEELTPFFLDFLDRVPYTAADLDTAALAACVAEIAATGGHLHLDDGLTPLNSGSVALVFKGGLRTADGQTRAVVIKVLRKGIAAELERMRTHYRWLGWLLHYGWGLDIGPLLRDTAASYAAQTDLVQEGANIQLFYDAFRGHRTILIPKVYAASPNGLVMDYFLGVPPTQWRTEDYRACCSLFTTFLLTAYFVKELYHGDLHLGNLMFMRDGEGGWKMAVLDYGVVGRLTVPSQNFIYYTLDAVARNNYIDLVTAFVDYVLDEEPLRGARAEEEETPAKAEERGEDFRATVLAGALRTLEEHECTNVYAFRHTHIRLLYQEVTRHGLTLSPNLNCYLFSILAMVDTLKELASKDVTSNLTRMWGGTPPHPPI